MKVYVGLSGGVDSSVAAHLLLKAGHDVTGVFLRTWQPTHVPCTQEDDERAAFRAAVALGIPFRTLDLSEHYKTQVAAAFIDGYARGETPNPDVLCNREVKFGAFLDWALCAGADAVATGHYARIQKHGTSFRIRKAVDPDKDQSYFLSMVPAELLSKILFPLGDSTKQETRAIAERLNLPNARRPDSQGICFLGEVDLRAFLEPYMPLMEGDVLDSEGTCIGRHAGAQLYTLGERHGFALQVQSPHMPPLYVGAIDLKSNTIVLVEKNQIPTHRSATLRDAVDFGIDPSGKYTAQVRYHAKLLDVRVSRNGDCWTVHFDTPTTLAAGQSVSVYDQDVIVLSGILTTPQ